MKTSCFTCSIATFTCCILLYTIKSYKILFFAEVHQKIVAANGLRPSRHEEKNVLIVLEPRSKIPVSLGRWVAGCALSASKKAMKPGWREKMIYHIASGND